MHHPYVSSLLHGALLHRLLAAAPRSFAPPARLDEAADQPRLRLDLPGVAKRDIEIAVDDDCLSVTGKRVIDGEEFSFARTFCLAEEIDREGIKADLQDGVLTLTLPRKPEAQPKKQRIPIA